MRRNVHRSRTARARRTENADLLVVGSRNRGLVGHVFLNADTRAPLNGASCPVAIARNADGLFNIGVGMTVRLESRRALGAARGLAARQGSPVRALSVVSIQDIPNGEPIRANWPQFAKQLVDDQLNSPDIVAHDSRDATYGHPGEELARFSDELDLLIVGSRGYGPLERLLNGRTANYLVRHARCPLLVLQRRAATSDQHAPPASTDKLPVAARDLEREPSVRLG